MRSRYDYMKESKVKSDDAECYPDILSVQYNNYQPTYVPAMKTLSSVDIQKFYNFMYKTYGIQDLDDILLSINNVPYLGMLEPGNKIFTLKESDIIKFITGQQ